MKRLLISLIGILSVFSSVTGQTNNGYYNCMRNENLYKGCNLNSSFSTRVNARKDDLEIIQKNGFAIWKKLLPPEPITLIDSSGAVIGIDSSSFEDYRITIQTIPAFALRIDGLEFHIDPYFQDARYGGVGFICDQTSERLTFQWLKDKSKKNDFIYAYDLFVTYSSDYSEMRNDSDSTTIVFSLLADGGGGYFKIDPAGSFFLKTPCFYVETRFSPATPAEIEKLTKRVIDIFWSLPRNQSLSN